MNRGGGGAATSWWRNDSRFGLEIRISVIPLVKEPSVAGGPVGDGRKSRLI